MNDDELNKTIREMNEIMWNVYVIQRENGRSKEAAVAIAVEYDRTLRETA